MLSLWLSLPCCIFLFLLLLFFIVSGIRFRQRYHISSRSKQQEHLKKQVPPVLSTRSSCSFTPSERFCSTPSAKNEGCSVRVNTGGCLLIIGNPARAEPVASHEWHSPWQVLDRVCFHKLLCRDPQSRPFHTSYKAYQ